MNISPIRGYQVNGNAYNHQKSSQKSNLSFGEAFYTVSEKNNGKYITSDVVAPFKAFIYPHVKAMPGVKEIQDKHSDTTDFFALGAGSGSRFKPLALTYNKEANKISFPIPLDDEEGNNLHMFDFALARASHYAKDDKINEIMVKEANGTFGQVVERYLDKDGNIKDPKNVIVCCGDNQFDTKDPLELDKFFEQILNDPTKKEGLIGVARTPEEVAGKFGCMKVAEGGDSYGSDTLKLTGFAEKPPIDVAKDMALKDKNGNDYCVANTGMFVIKKDAMEWLLGEIKKDPKFIAKDDKEIYDFSTAVAKVQEHYGQDACDVKVVETWEDLGNPKDFCKAIEQEQQGKFLNVLGEKPAGIIQDALNRRYDAKTNTLLTAENYASINTYNEAKKAGKTPVDVNVTDIDGINVIGNKQLNIEA